jgi:hypothetical protein
MKHTSKLQSFKEHLKSEIRLILKEEYSEMNELARIAKTLKIGDKDKAQAVIEKFKLLGKKTWIATMIEKVMEAGETGITQVDLAKALGKIDEFGDGRQQAINPEVRSLLDGGVFSINSATVDVPTSVEEPTMASEPSSAPIDNSISEPTETDLTTDDEEEEVEDEFYKAEEEDVEDEEELAQKIAPSKGVQSKAKQLDNVIKQLKDLKNEMQQIASEYKKAKEAGNKDEETRLVALLKSKSAKKQELENQENELADEF